MPDPLSSSDAPRPYQPAVPAEWPAFFAELTAVLLSTSTVDEALRQLADIVCRTVPGDPLSGITLRRGDHVTTVASSGAHAMLINEVQYAHGGGPCLEAMSTGAVVQVPDVTSETRWGTYPARMLAHGVHAISSHPLRADGTVLGALNIYATTAGGFGEQARGAIATTAEHTGVLLQATLTAAAQVETTAQMRQALASRTVIDQALGIIMAQQRCTAEAAFAILRTASQHRNRKLHDVATDIVARISGRQPTPAPFVDPGQ